MSASTKKHIVIVDGPHQGAHDVDLASDIVNMAMPSDDPTREATYHRYRQVRPLPSDFQQGIDGRYEWVP